MAEAENWPQCRARTSAFRDGAAMLPRLHIAFDDETPEETAWNDAYERLLERRIVVKTGLAGYSKDGRAMGDGDQYGVANYMRWGANAPLYGFMAFYVSWEKGYGLKGRDDRLILTPLLHSAVWTVTATEVKYMSGGGIKTLPRDRVLWISSGDAPFGYARGKALLRALVQPWTAYQEQVIAEDIDTSMRAGMLIMYTGDAGGKSAPDYELIGESFASGNRYVTVPNSKGGDSGATIEVAYPSGTPPDFESKAKRLRAHVDDLFGTEVQSLATNGNGSRAVGEVIADITAKVGIASGDALIDLLVGAPARWIAHHDGYTGRVRQVSVAIAGDADPHKLIETIARANSGPTPMIDMGPVRKAHIAELM
mgnify:CR=1 FL=1